MYHKTFLMTFGLLVAINLKAQENQTVKAEKSGDGTYMKYPLHKTSGAYVYEGISSDPWTLTSRVYEEKYKEIDVKQGEAASTETYFPDNLSFPATYVKGYYETDPAIAKHKLIRKNEEKRMVFVDEWVYFLEDFKDKDNYEIVAIIKKGEIKGMKLMKEAMSAPKMMEGMDHPKKLQTYLDEAFKKQAEAVPTDSEKAINDKQEKLKVRYQFVIDSTNGKYWNSEQGQAKLKEFNQADVVLINDTKADFGFCYAQGVSQTLKPGEKYTFTCKSGKVMKGKPRANSTQLDATDQLLFDLDGKKCGVTYNASQF